MSIEFKGNLWRGKITPQIRKAANETKEYGERLVKEYTPVDTGRLKSNWKGKVERSGIRWSNDTPYAVYVELGTRKMKAQPMLSKALPDINDHFQQRLAFYVGKSLARRSINFTGNIKDSLSGRDSNDINGRIRRGKPFNG